ncbi:pumilio RNA binding protein [Penicillium taxi]|uniref:pumilio RNA binding protein n=1 Tax=Penicillium taxi TaxID=168475 RepID=UPI002544F92E|nr:pumilio RNA binding protein [Penicillium taxi]KAJ5907997.1 pumilio RNA binding protein [Penicillium taxi]
MVPPSTNHADGSRLTKEPPDPFSNDARTSIYARDVLVSCPTKYPNHSFLNTHFAFSFQVQTSSSNISSPNSANSFRRIPHEKTADVPPKKLEQSQSFPPFSNWTDQLAYRPSYPQRGPVGGPSTETYGAQFQREQQEIATLKEELIAANSRLSQQEQELTQFRVINHTLEYASSEAEFGGRETDHQAQRSNVVGSRFPTPWNTREPQQLAVGGLIQGPFDRSRGLWDPNGHEPQAMQALGVPNHQITNFMSQGSDRFWGGSTGHPSSVPHRVFSGPSAGAFGYQPPHRYGPPVEQRRPTAVQQNQWSGFVPRSMSEAAPVPPTSPSSGFHSTGSQSNPTFPARQRESSVLSPTANEFTVTGPHHGQSLVSRNSSNYVASTEPLNYRLLGEKNVMFDWNYLVEKIVCSDDQQASIFLQNKLKVCSANEKHAIVDRIAESGYSLMLNRFGNFLIQRCFEHGTPEQVLTIANSMRGKVRFLSMDAFGCHVVQKALDCVPEEPKAMLVQELLQGIPETVNHKYACHVWQKLFEIRWTSEAPRIMGPVNDALRGIWHNIACGETGSLVVQNIFENCVDDDKRLAIEEILKNLKSVSRGQYGNWCIQHICEHGAPLDKSRAVEHVLFHAVEYSMDQYASKIVEKCLKIGNLEFLDRYLARLCISQAGRPRIPLIDVASDQYGNYLIQWILQHSSKSHVDLVSVHIQKHMVSLRGSKYGSRVAMACSNPNHSTRPGPGTGSHRFNGNFNNEDRFSRGRYGGRQWGGNYR